MEPSFAVTSVASRGGTNETGFYLNRLKTAGMDVLFSADAIPACDEGELILGVKFWQDRQYLLKLARDTIRGQISNIRERKIAPGGVAPYGYDKQHLTADGIVLRTLRWMPDGSKHESGSDGNPLRVIEPASTRRKPRATSSTSIPVHRIDWQSSIACSISAFRIRMPHHHGYIQCGGYPIACRSEMDYIPSRQTAAQSSHRLTICRDRRWPGPEGEGYRTFSCTRYHPYGKCVCSLVNVPRAGPRDVCAAGDQTGVPREP